LKNFTPKGGKVLKKFSGRGPYVSKTDKIVVDYQAPAGTFAIRSRRIRGDSGEARDSADWVPYTLYMYIYKGPSSWPSAKRSLAGVCAVSSWFMKRIAEKSEI